ncbi:hypothetical protein D3C80_1601520 [compost metagenome]
MIHESQGTYSSFTSFCLEPCFPRDSGLLLAVGVDTSLLTTTSLTITVGMTVTSRFFHIPPQITTASNALIVLIFNEFFFFEDSKGSHMKTIQWQISDPALETDFLYLVTNAPDLLG